MNMIKFQSGHREANLLVWTLMLSHFNESDIVNHYMQANKSGLSIL